MEDGRDDEARAAVAAARSLATDGLGEARRAVYALRDESGDLVGALRPLVVCEALINARRHAPGSPASVVVVFSPGLLTATVENDTPTGGSRFVDGAGVGLTGMRERAAEIGATLFAGPRVEHNATAGWRVRAEVRT
jgi:signal transduction histidine kinase